MADQPVTREKLINADIDVENLGKAVNEKGVVNPRYGDPYLTLPSAIQKVIETGGFEPFATEAALLTSTPILEKKASYALDTHRIWLWEDGAWKETGLSAIDQAKNFTEDYVSLGALDLFAKYIDLGYSSNMLVRRYTAVATYNDYPAGTYQALSNSKVQMSVVAGGSNAIKHYFSTEIPAQNFEAEFTVTHQQLSGDAIGVGFKSGENNEIITLSSSGNIARIANYTHTVLQSGLGTYGVGDTVKFIYNNSKISIFLNGALKGEASIAMAGTILVGQMGFSRYLSVLGGGKIDPIRDYVASQISSASFQDMSVGYYSYNATNQTFFAYTQVKGSLYVGFEVKREVDMRDLIYQDYWRIFQALFYTFDGETMQPTGKVALGVGESEFVFKQVSAKDDFTGGYHGDEIATSIKLMVDGFPISTASSIPLTAANKLEYIVQSTMHETSEGGIFVPGHPVIADHTKHTEFLRGGYKTRNILGWKYAGTLSTLYHGIACIHKDVASIVFTDKDFTDQAMMGSGNNYFNAIGARLYKGRNPTNGLAVEAAAYQQKVDGADALSELFVHDRSTDSKYYRKSPARTVSIGEKHESYLECYFTAT